MKHPNIVGKGIMIAVLFTLFFMGCAQQQKRSKEPQQTTPKVSSSAKQSPKAAKMMKVAFCYPVVMVNTARAQKQEDEYQQRIEVAYPENSVQDIAITVVNLDKEEKSLYGKIKLFQYTQYSKVENPAAITVAADNPEIYENILRHGYGEITVTELIQDPQNSQKNTAKAPIVVQLILGTKKDTNKIEFRFPENTGASIDGKEPPVSFYFPENSHQNLKLAMDDGNVQLQGVLDVYEQTSYTLYAPVWITFDDKTKEYLRSRGGKVDIALCVPAAPQPNDTVYVKSLNSGEDPTVAAQKHGTLVGLFRVRRVN
jgi:hypothetical protein